MKPSQVIQKVLVLVEVEMFDGLIKRVAFNAHIVESFSVCQDEL